MVMVYYCFFLDNSLLFYMGSSKRETHTECHMANLQSKGIISLWVSKKIISAINMVQVRVIIIIFLYPIFLYSYTAILDVIFG